MSLIWILVLYTAVCILIAQSEISYLKARLKDPPCILDEKLFYESIKIGIENKRLEIFSSLYTLAINACWLGFGLVWLKDLAIKSDTVFQNTGFLLVFLLLYLIFALPVSYFKQMVQDKKHGFSNMSLALFCKDSLKAILLTAFLGFFILFALLSCVEFLGSLWWLGAFVLSFFFVLVANVLYPTLIAPIFNKMSKLEEPKLLAKITALMQKSGFLMDGVYIMDASKRDNRLNAYFAGLFKSKRVVLFDTLLKALKENELLAVLAHELGHFKHKDLLKGLACSACLLFILFFILGHLPESFFACMGLAGVSSAKFVALLLFSNVLSLVFTPFINALSRKNEYAADAYAAKEVGALDMKAALIALARENKAFISHSFLESFFNHSHPSIKQRLEALDKC